MNSYRQITIIILLLLTAGLIGYIVYIVGLRQPAEEPIFTDGPAPGLTITSQIQELEETSTGVYRIVYLYTITNSGTMPVVQLRATSDLGASFGTVPFTVESLTSSSLSINSTYNGTTNRNLLSGTDTLAIGQVERIYLTVTITPGDFLGPYVNYVEVFASAQVPPVASSSSSSSRTSTVSSSRSSTSSQPSSSATTTISSTTTSFSGLGTPTATSSSSSAPSSTSSASSSAGQPLAYNSASVSFTIQQSSTGEDVIVVSEQLPVGDGGFDELATSGFEMAKFQWVGLAGFSLVILWYMAEKLLYRPLSRNV